MAPRDLEGPTPTRGNPSTKDTHCEAGSVQLLVAHPKLPKAMEVQLHGGGPLDVTAPLGPDFRVPLWWRRVVYVSRAAPHGRARALKRPALQE